MDTVTLTSKNYIYPKQPFLVDERINNFGKIPNGAQRVKISSISHDGKGVGIIFTFLSNGTIAHYWVWQKFEADFEVMLKGENVEYYIILNRMAGDATEVTFDLAFE